jgi:murein L,D-transpeptidase YcbB/YkuD
LVAVRRFQWRHGLEQTGIVDAETLAELNVTADARVNQIKLNLERWRWLPQDLGRRRIEVNIAAYELQVIDDDEVAMRMRVVVGKAYRRTPVFSDTVRYIVLNPNWHVPKHRGRGLIQNPEDSMYLERFGTGCRRWAPGDRRRSKTVD